MTYETKNIVFKLKHKLKLDKDGELAKAMGVNRATFSSWLQRGSFNLDILIDFCKKNNISLDWLFEFDTKNAISEPKTEYKPDELDSIKTRIEIVEQNVNRLLKEIEK